MKDPTMSEKKYASLPDFLIIGAGKSGTTSLDKYLNQHPQIFIPKTKEPNFFGYERTSIEDLPDEDKKHYQRSVTTLQAYLALFAEARPDQVKGETSNTYMYHLDAPERIQHYIPGVKLIAVLRQPAGRLYSRYLHLARENRVPTRAFTDCFDRSTIWWQRNDLVKEGFYYEYLSRYYSRFPAENIRVYLYEDFQSNPAAVLKDIFEFVGVDSQFKPDLSIRYNESGIVKNKVLNAVIGQGGLLSRSIQVLFPPSAYEKMKKNLSLKKKITNLRGKNLAQPKLDNAVRQRITEEIYGDDIRKLQQLIGKDLSHWLNIKS